MEPFDGDQVDGSGEAGELPWPQPQPEAEAEAEPEAAAEAEAPTPLRGDSGTDEPGSRTGRRAARSVRVRRRRRILLSIAGGFVSSESRPIRSSVR